MTKEKYNNRSGCKIFYDGHRGSYGHNGAYLFTNLYDSRMGNSVLEVASFPYFSFIWRRIYLYPGITYEFLYPIRLCKGIFIDASR